MPIHPRSYSYEPSMTMTNTLSADFAWGLIPYNGEQWYGKLHIHNYVEIYINVSGDVSFMVEGRLYPITRGDIIITIPNEFHYCVYNSTCIHENYCIWFSCDETNLLLRRFYERSKGNNLLSLGAKGKKRLLELCRRLRELWDNPPSEIQRTAMLLELIALIEEGMQQQAAHSELRLPYDVMIAVNYINTHFSTIESVGEIAKQAFISQSTLDRWFHQWFQISPRQYLDATRLAAAKQMLEDGVSVQDACMQCGYTDYSHFIAKFKKQFAITATQDPDANDRSP